MGSKRRLIQIWCICTGVRNTIIYRKCSEKQCSHVVIQWRWQASVRCMWVPITNYVWTHFTILLFWSVGAVEGISNLTNSQSPSTFIIPALYCQTRDTKFILLAFAPQYLHSLNLYFLPSPQMMVYIVMWCLRSQITSHSMFAFFTYKFAGARTNFVNQKQLKHEFRAKSFPITVSSSYFSLLLSRPLTFSYV